MDNPHIARLLRASARDEACLQFDLPDENFGFHVQQAVEKLYKVLIVAHGQELKFTHDLEDLASQLTHIGEVVAPMSIVRDALNAYAVEARYDDGPLLSPMLRDQLRGEVVTLREYVMARVGALQASGAEVQKP